MILYRDKISSRSALSMQQFLIQKQGELWNTHHIHDISFGKICFQKLKIFMKYTNFDNTKYIKLCITEHLNYTPEMNMHQLSKCGIIAYRNVLQQTGTTLEETLFNSEFKYFVRNKISTNMAWNFFSSPTQPLWFSRAVPYSAVDTYL